MDIAAASTAVSGAGVLGDINLSLLSAQQHFASAVASELAASIGLGTAVDAYA